MKSKNLILGAALAGVFGTVSLSSTAGTIGSLPRNFAYPLFQGSTPTPIAIAPISFSTAVPLAPSTLYYVYVALTNGATFNTALGSLAFELPGGTGTYAPTSVTGPTLSADSTYEIFAVTTSASPLNNNSTITFTLPSADVIASGLSTVGSTVSGTILVAGISQTSGLPTGSNVVDNAGNGVVAISAAPTTASVLASNTAAFAALTASTPPAGEETTQIDVVAQSGKKLTAGLSGVAAPQTIVDFGAFVLSDVSDVYEANGTTPYSIATVSAVTAASLNFTVTGNFNAFKGSGTKVYLSTTNNCAAAAIPATSVTATTATFSGIANGTTGTARYICGAVDGTTLITPTTPTVSGFTLTDAATSTTYVTTAPSNTLYPLNTNGSIVDTWLYFPAVVTSQATYLRVINVGTVAAQASVAVINDVTGTTGTSNPIGSVLPVGGAEIFSQSQIEAVTGALPNTRPRLQFTAPGQIRVQTFVVSGTSATIGDLNAAQGVSPTNSPASNGN